MDVIAFATQDEAREQRQEEESDAPLGEGSRCTAFAKAATTKEVEKDQLGSFGDCRKQRGDSKAPPRDGGLYKVRWGCYSDYERELF